jgi:dihydrofolate reductase
MRRIVNSTYITLDGIIQNPQDWPSLGSFSEEGSRLQSELLARCDTVLMGRHTYDGFAPVWSGRTGDPYSDRINAMEKLVVSTTLTDPTWENTTVIDQDPIGAVRAAKQRPGGDIVQFGFGRLTHALLADRLLDELRLWLHPFLLGTGSSDDLLHHSGVSAEFELAGTQTLGTGIVVLTYRAAH